MKPSREDIQKRRQAEREKVKKGTPQPKSSRPDGKTSKSKSKAKSVKKFAGFEDDEIDGVDGDDDNVNDRTNQRSKQRSRSRSLSISETCSDSEYPSDCSDDENVKKSKSNLMVDGKRRGTKWLAKQQAKEDKKKRLEQEKKDREEAKKKEEEEYQDRKRAEREEEEVEKKIEEERLKQLELKRQKEEDEYNQMKADFEIEEEGEENTEEAMENEKEVLNRFVNHIKSEKIIMMDELASKFNLKTPDCIDRIKALLEDGTLTGVIDDRGKFIYISYAELEGIAAYVKNKGRVSKAELSRNSGNLIDLPKVS